MFSNIRIVFECKLNRHNSTKLVISRYCSLNISCQHQRRSMYRGIQLNNYRLATLATALALITSTGQTYADGTEDLGAPNIPIALGSDMIAAGTGLKNASNTGSIDIDVPAGVSVEQVLLYWEGRFNDVSGKDGPGAIDAMSVNGINVVGVRIGGGTGPGSLDLPNVSSAYRADITDITGLELLPGVLSTYNLIANLSFPNYYDGASILAILDDGSNAILNIRDGSDYAFCSAPAPVGNEQTMVQDFVFNPSTQDRTAVLLLMAGDVKDQRPNEIVIEVDGVKISVSPDAFTSSDGDQWDTIELSFSVPAGSSSISAQMLSIQPEPQPLCASLVWVVGALKLNAPDDVLACRYTGGGNFNPNGRIAGRNGFTFGGQAGANTALQPQPKGEWTHSQHKGPDGMFTFHVGTASASPGTEIDLITCSDPGWCVQARPAPAKQLHFDGIGEFKNIVSNPSGSLMGAVAKRTKHWVEVDVHDLGEPGRAGQFALPGPQCPPEGFIGEIADCSCPDFYQIIIYKAYDFGKEPPNKTDVIYKETVYHAGGNFQIHPLTGFDAKGNGPTTTTTVKTTGNAKK